MRLWLISIWIFDAQFFKNASFERFHGIGLFICFMIIAEKMQDSMNKKVQGVAALVLSLFQGLADQGFPRHGDIAEEVTLA